MCKMLCCVNCISTIFCLGGCSVEKEIWVCLKLAWDIICLGAWVVWIAVGAFTVHMVLQKILHILFLILNTSLVIRKSNREAEEHCLPKNMAGFFIPHLLKYFSRDQIHRHLLPFRARQRNRFLIPNKECEIRNYKSFKFPPWEQPPPSFLAIKCKLWNPNYLFFLD